MAIDEKQKVSFRDRVKTPFRFTGGFIKKYSMVSFFAILALLTGLILLGSFIRKPKETIETQESAPKEVHTFSLANSSKLVLSGSVEKAGIATIVAQSSGIVSSINVHEGDKVRQGQTLVSLSTSYSRGTAQSVSRQIAQKNHAFLTDNYSLQKEALARQRDTAEHIYQQGQDTREIGRNAQSDTKAMIASNEQLLANIDAQIAILTDPALIAQARESRASLVSGLSQLKSALTTSEYQNNNDEDPSQGANAQKEATFRQLEIQEKTLDLNKDLSQLNLRIAQITESLMYPATPFSGTVEKVFVKKGDSVSPGSVLAQVTGTNTSATATLLVTHNIAKRIARIEETTITIGSEEVFILPRYISSQPTDGTLYSIFYTIPQKYVNNLTNGELLSFEVPLSMEESQKSEFYVPVDSVYQSEDSAYLFIIENTEDGKLRAVEKQITLGDVSGSFVKVLSGIETAARIITDRNVLSGDLVFEK